MFEVNENAIEFNIEKFNITPYVKILMSLISSFFSSLNKR